MTTCQDQQLKTGKLEKSRPILQHQTNTAQHRHSYSNISSVLGLRRRLAAKFASLPTTTSIWASHSLVCQLS